VKNRPFLSEYTDAMGRSSWMVGVMAVEEHSPAALRNKLRALVIYVFITSNISVCREVGNAGK
jgi:hypothetical protein